MESEKLTLLEEQAVKMLLAGDVPALAALRKQVQSARVLKRQYTGVGYFAQLQTDAQAALPSRPTFVLSDVFSDFSSPEEDFLGAFFLLHVSEGEAVCLEVAAVGSIFPPGIDEELREGLRYDGNRERDLRKVASRIRAAIDDRQ